MTEISVNWTYEYNTLNQLKKRYDGASWTGADGDTRWSYEYDKNGNLTKATKQEKASGTWGEKLRFEYDWNPRDQMERVDKFVNGAAIPVGYVVYRYCLSCDGSLSEREEHGAYSGGSHPIVSWQRYEYHGLDLARVDERYDTSGGSISSGDRWRTLGFYAVIFVLQNVLQKRYRVFLQEVIFEPNLPNPVKFRVEEAFPYRTRVIRAEILHQEILCQVSLLDLDLGSVRMSTRRDIFKTEMSNDHHRNTRRRYPTDQSTPRLETQSGRRVSRLP